MQCIGSAVVDVTPGDHFEFIARQTSGSTKDVADDELTWFAIEVVEGQACAPLLARSASPVDPIELQRKECLVQVSE